jgi:hypothetical protein
MNKLILCFLSVIILSSCQKEFSESNDGGQPTEDSSGNKRLVMQKMISGTNFSDTLTTEYGYNNAGKLETETYTGKVVESNGTVKIRTSYTRYYRDAMDRILKIARKGYFSDNVSNADTLFEYITYTSATSTKIASINNGALIYEYNSLGQVYKTSSYMPWPNPGDPLKLVVYHLYSYNAKGNLTKREEYVPDANGAFRINITSTFEYDDKKNPLHSTDDALLEWRSAWMSPDNVVKQSNDYADPLSTDDQIITIYEYSADGFPYSGAYNLGPQPIILKYYYQ